MLELFLQTHVKRFVGKVSQVFNFCWQQSFQTFGALQEGFAGANVQVESPSLFPLLVQNWDVEVQKPERFVEETSLQNSNMGPKNAKIW